MPIIAARRYSKGKAHEVEILLDGQPLRPPGPDVFPGTFDWIGMCDPSVEEMEMVRRQYGLHPLAVEDALSPHQLPKVEIYGEQLFVVARTASFDAGAVTIRYGQTACFIGRDFIITVRLGSQRAHDELRRMLEANAERLAEGADYVLHAVLDFIVDGYLPMADHLEDLAQTIEESAIETFPDPATIRRIFRLRRELRRFDRIIGPMEEMVKRLVVAELPTIDPSEIGRAHV